MHRVLGILLLSLITLGAGCKKRMAAEGEAPEEKPSRPRRTEVHVVTLERVQFSEQDFSSTALGEPLSVKISIREDGEDIPPSSGLETILGTRGERVMDPQIEWLITFDPDKYYQIVLSEQPPPGESGRRIFLPTSPRRGDWPLGSNDGVIAFGQGSYLKFADRISAE